MRNATEQEISTYQHMSPTDIIHDDLHGNALFDIAKQYFELNPNKRKFSYALETNHNANPITTHLEFTWQKHKVFAIYHPDGKNKKLLEQNQKPRGIDRALWNSKFKSAEEFFLKEGSDIGTYTKLVNLEKREHVSFFKIESKIFLQMKKRTCLGKGAFGVTKLLKSEDGQLLAIKKEWLKVGIHSMREQIESEQNIAKKVGLAIDGFVIEEANKAYTIMHFYPNTFSEHINNLFKPNEPPVRIHNLNLLLNLLMKLIVAVKTLNLTHNIIHRDIHKGNILFNNEGEISIVDFGKAKLADSGKYYSKQKPGNTAPKHYSPEAKDQGVFSFESDIFALGNLYQKLYAELDSRHLIDASPDLKELILSTQNPLANFRPNHEYIELTLNLMIKRESIGDEQYNKEKENIKLKWRQHLLFQLKFDLDFIKKEDDLDPFLKAQLLRDNFELFFFDANGTVISEIKTILEIYCDDGVTTEKNPLSNPALFKETNRDAQIKKKIQHEKIKEKITTSPLFSLDHQSSIIQEHLSALKIEIELILHPVQEVRCSC